MKNNGKVVVIGGSGFLGSHTADELSKRGYQVTIFDRSPSPWINHDQKIILGDILDLEAVKKVISGADYVYHFAGMADIGEAKSSPINTIELNVMGATTVLEAAVETKVKRFVYASTMYVYSPYGSFYRASKQAAETIIEAYYDKYDLPYVLLRFGSLYGPRAQSWNGLKRYVSEIVRTGTLDFQGTGRERREFIHVEDAARLSVDILNEAHKNHAITVTGQQVISLKDLIEMIHEIAGVEFNIAFSDTPPEADHYAMTPYRYTPKRAKKIVPAEFIDFGQGVLDIVEEVHHEMTKKEK
jgi:UDP-glucose 4-epimerase